MIVVLIVGFVGLLALAYIEWRRWQRQLEDERLAEIARAGMSRERFPSMYVGPDTRYGLRSGTPVRRLRAEQGNVVRVRTPDGRDWLVRDNHVARRPGAPPPPPPPGNGGPRQRAPRGEVYR